MQSVDLENNNINDGCTKSFIKVLQTSVTLRKVNLCGNQITDKFRVNILPALRKNVCIYSLRTSEKEEKQKPGTLDAVISISKMSVAPEVVEFESLLESNRQIYLCRSHSSNALSLMNRQLDVLSSIITNLKNLTSLNVTNNNLTVLQREVTTMINLKVCG